MAGINGEHLRTVREKDGSSPTQLAARVVNPATGKPLHLQYLLDIESGKRTLKRNPGLIKALADALNVPMSMLEKRAAEQVAS